MTPKKIIVLCTGNSCRSQMAQAFINHYGGASVDCLSAGLLAKGVNTRAIKVMQEKDLDISHHTSNVIDEYLDQEFDLIITVCDHAKETCPVFPSHAKKIHRSFDDPDREGESEEDTMARFRRVRDEIEQFSRKLIYSLQEQD